jgi:hypothetical protein
MNVDPKNAFTYTAAFSPKSQTNNTGSAGIDLKGYVGNVGVLVMVGTKTAGDNDGAITVRIQSSATNNISNATNYGTSTVATTNNTVATGVLNVDTRAAYRYLFITPAVSGTNSPAYPLSAAVIGKKQVQP